jgi:two-component system, cell cycle response regulator DivK
MKKVLIVDDHEPTQTLLAHVMKSLQTQVVSALTMEEGLRLAYEEQPDVILMDIYMPGAINGWEATQKIKTDTALQHIPVIIITAGATPGDSERVKQVNAAGYFKKPFNMPALMACIRQLL